MPSSSESDRDRHLSRKRKHAPSSSATAAAAAAGSGGRSSASTITADMETGQHELTVSGYSGTRGLGVGRFISSATFAVGGHGWRIRYYPDGYNEDCDGGIFFSLIRDDDDDDGDCRSAVVASGGEVRASYEFSLLDEAGEPVPSAFAATSGAPRSFKNRHWGSSPDFMSPEELESSPHLRDDSFRIRCRVTVVKLRPAARTLPARLAAAPSPDLPRHLGELLAAGVGADVMFVVGGEVFPAHRSVLAARSPVLRAELFGCAMRERRSTHVYVDDMEPRVFEAVLRFVYTDALPEMEETRERRAMAMAQHLLVAADRYGLERLKLICEDMLRSFVDTSTVESSLVLAEQHGCHGLKEGCFRFLRAPGNMKAVLASNGLKHLKRSCPSLFEELLMKVLP
ncbi:hypothetical protein ACP4OV_001925 [Aristida adscensionis]